MNKDIENILVAKRLCGQGILSLNIFIKCSFADSCPLADLFAIDILYIN